MIRVELSDDDAKCLAYFIEQAQEEFIKKGIYLNSEVCFIVSDGINLLTGRRSSTGRGELLGSNAYYTLSPSIRVIKEKDLT